MDFSLVNAQPIAPEAFTFVCNHCLRDALQQSDRLVYAMQSVAVEALTFACNKCHRDALQQKTRILQFLIPVQMLLGKLPSAAIRQKYNMHIYDTIIEVSFVCPYHMLSMASDTPLQCCHQCCWSCAMLVQRL